MNEKSLKGFDRILTRRIEQIEADELEKFQKRLNIMFQDYEDRIESQLLKLEGLVSITVAEATDKFGPLMGKN